MSCVQLLMLAPVFLEIDDQLESDKNAAATEIILLQDGSDFMSAYEILIEPPAMIKENQPVTCTSGIPHATYTSGISNASRASRIANASRAAGIPNATLTSGIPNTTLTSGIPNTTLTSGIPTSDLLSSLPSNLDRNYLNFPFLTDRQTFNYLSEKYTKVMFIMRGLSGSGKSSIVSMIKSAFKHVVVCSADHYFYKTDGKYQFDQTLLSAAHETCQQKAKKACSGQVPIVVIDNTNVRRWELRFYAGLANNSGYVAVVVQPQTPWRWNAEELAARSLHGVSVEVLQRKIDMFDDVIPLYYGWFPNKKHSECLTRLCLKSFEECLSKFPDFKRDLLKEFRIRPDNINEEINNGILAVYIESNSNPVLHCTAKFCARGKVPEAKDYHRRLDVQQACGKMFVLRVAGLVFTSKSIGARVSLGSSESVFFSRPEEAEWDAKIAGSQRGRETSRKDLVTDSSEDYYEVVTNGNRKAKKNPARFLKKQQRKQKNSLKKGEQVDTVSVTEKNGRVHIRDSEVSQLENAAVPSGINEVDEESVSLAEMFPCLNFSKKTRSTHFTIKTARGVESRAVNFDILHACDVEGATSYTKSSFVPVTRGHACYYGDSLCCVYFDKPLHVQTLFSGNY